MDGDARLNAALRHIGMSGSLDGAPGTPNEKTVLMTVAQKRGLVVWKRSRGCYKLTRAGYSLVAASFSYRTSFRDRLSRPVLVVAGLAVLMAGYVAIGAARVTSYEEVRKPKPSQVDEVASIPTVAPQAVEAPALLSVDVEPQPAPLPAASRTAPSAAQSDRHAADRIPPGREPKKQKVARKHRHHGYAEARARRHEMGPVSAFAAEARSTRRGYPAFPGAAGFGFAQPNGWGR